MKVTYTAIQWRELYRQCQTRQQRDALTGLPINLAARLLGISRGRISQLVEEDKLNGIIVRDETTSQRVAYMITLESLDRRRAIRRLPGQWRPREIV